jgi:toxin ParE1/3/4
MSSSYVAFHQLALREFEEARAWYYKESPITSERFKVAVEAATDRILRSCESLPRFSGEYRWVRVERFQYILVFRRRTDREILVVAVAHTSRRPGYWRRRR